MKTKTEALDDLLWLKKQLELERDFGDRAPSTIASSVAEQILNRIEPAIEVLQPETKEVGEAQ